MGIQLPAATSTTPIIKMLLRSMPPCPILHWLVRQSRELDPGSCWSAAWWEKNMSQHDMRVLHQKECYRP
jgi:hypothetical protein